MDDEKEATIRKIRDKKMCEFGPCQCFNYLGYAYLQTPKLDKIVYMIIILIRSFFGEVIIMHPYLSSPPLIFFFVGWAVSDKT